VSFFLGKFASHRRGVMSPPTPRHREPSGGTSATAQGRRDASASKGRRVSPLQEPGASSPATAGDEEVAHALRGRGEQTLGLADVAGSRPPLGRRRAPAALPEVVGG
jgi:hypothetical protein